jgi:hypothetical protein
VARFSDAARLRQHVTWANHKDAETASDYGCLEDRRRCSNVYLHSAPRGMHARPNQVFTGDPRATT